MTIVRSPWGPTEIPASLGRWAQAPEAARHPFTGPITLPPADPDRMPTSDPAHWHPRHDEPVYGSVWQTHREQLLAGLLSLGEVTR